MPFACPVMLTAMDSHYGRSQETASIGLGFQMSNLDKVYGYCTYSVFFVTQAHIT